MADAASPAARPILARGPAGRPLSAPSPPTLASVPERLHAHGKAGLSLERPDRHRRPLVPVSSSPRPPRSAGRGCPHVRLLVYSPGVALLLVTEFPSDK